MPESASVVQTHSNCSKLKRSQIMSSDEWGLVEREGDPARHSSGTAFLPLTIVDKAEWLGNPANIKGANKDAKI